MHRKLQILQRILCIKGKCDSHISNIPKTIWSIWLFKAKQAEGDEKDPASVAGTEKAMTALKDTGEPKGSSFAAIQLQSKKQTKNSITLSWNKVKGAKGYIVYGSMCGSKYKLERIGKTTKKAFVYKKLKKGTYYKFTVAVYKVVNGTEQVIAKGKMIHVATKGGIFPDRRICQSKDYSKVIDFWRLYQCIISI